MQPSEKKNAKEKNTDSTSEGAPARKDLPYSNLKRTSQAPQKSRVARKGRPLPARGGERKLPP